MENYHGFELEEFMLNDCQAFLVKPKVETKEKKWIWRAEFFGGFDTVDVEMLNRGYYLAYYKISNMYGCPKSIDLMKSFYDVMIEKYNLCEKTIIFGFSRGGLYTTNFACKYPNLIKALYLDAPVLDIKSWPGGLMSGIGAKREWAECLECYGLDEQSVLNYKENPIDKFNVLADYNIPIVVVAGDNDEVVPHTENCEKLISYYRERNIENMYILKPTCGHHPHSLPDPMVVADFLTR